MKKEASPSFLKKRSKKLLSIGPDKSDQSGASEQKFFGSFFQKRTSSFSWLSILRLSLINAALGAIVTLTTITLNRVMVVELALPAILPGALIALHYAMQLARPRLGFGADRGGRRTPWIMGGLIVLAAGGMLAACATALIAHAPLAGLALAVPAYALVGLGVGAVGTASLTLLAAEVTPTRRPAAATIFWLLMIFGAVLTAGLTSVLLHPFSLARLLRVAAGVTSLALLVGAAALWRLESPGSIAPTCAAAGVKPAFATALREIWRERQARQFALFVFLSMLAYSGQELILEPFAGEVFALGPSRTAALTGLHQAGLLGGMLLVAIAGSIGSRRRAQAGGGAAMRLWTVGGCAASAIALLGLALAGMVGPGWPLRLNLAALGIANGAFAVAAIGAMMSLAGDGRPNRAGVRLGVWGAAQAIAMGLGGLLSAGASDLARTTLGTPALAYAAIFLCQAAMFLLAARLAAGLFTRAPAHPADRADPADSLAMAR